MDSDLLNAYSEALASFKLQAVRFEFAYMAARRHGERKPPPRAERLTDEFRAAVNGVRSKLPLIIGGHSMGGRVASLIADDLFAARRVSALVCLSYPFHPPDKPKDLRTAHLKKLATPTLICQGTRDPFGSPDEIRSYGLAPSISLLWLEDGDHGLKPRKASGFTHRDHIDAAARGLTEWWRSKT
jgi:predicted alpha/beta-hydrolase family hydrolase